MARMHLKLIPDSTLRKEAAYSERTGGPAKVSVSNFMTPRTMRPKLEMQNDYRGAGDISAE